MKSMKTVLPRTIIETLIADTQLQNLSFDLPTANNLTIEKTPLNYAVAVYLPAEDESQINVLKHQAALLFGGFSILELDGGWISQNGQLILDKILWFRVFMNFETLSYLEGFLETVYQLVKDWQQESLLIEVSNNTWTKRWLVDVL